MRYGVCILAAFLSCASLALAEDGVRPVGASAALPVDGEGMMSRCGVKFVRGLTNVLTGGGEIPRQIIVANRADGSFAAVPVGFFTGIFMTVARTGYGAVELVTFIAPLEGTYDSLLKPDYVWGPIRAKDRPATDAKELAK
jgi:putative exosortase-associated protein (TIGR04073 family)